MSLLGVTVLRGQVRDLFHERLRQPEFPSTVPRSLPVLFFGDILTANAATIALNPSWKEYLNPDGEELRGSERRLETLTSLRASSRAALKDEHCYRAIRRMLDYFSINPYFGYFGRLNRAASGMELDYGEGTLVHLDLVQEATQPAWSGLRRKAPEEADELRTRDRSFLENQLSNLPMKTVLCNGMTVLKEVRSFIGGVVQPAFKLKRVTAYTGAGEIDGRPVTVVGWNYPLHWAGLTSDEKTELGRRLAKSLR